MSDYDVIVVGGGIAGTGVSTLLQKEGLNTLLLEREETLGGRARTVSIDGWKTDIGLHLLSLGEGSTLNELCERVDAKINWANYSDDVEIYQEGEWTKASQFLSSSAGRKELKEVIQKISSIEDEEINRLDQFSWFEWVNNNIDPNELKHLFFIFGMIITTIVDPAEMAAGEILWVIRRSLRTRGELLAAAYPEGGFQSFLDELRNFFEKKGGEVRTSAQVDEIVIEKGEAVGVDLQKEPAIPSKFAPSPVETISADKIICAVPLWDLPQVLDLRNMPSWWAKRIMDIRFETTGYFGYILGLPNQIFDQTHFWASMETENTGLPFQAFSPSNFDKDVAPGNKMLMVCGCPIEYVNMNKFSLKRLHKLMWKDVKKLFPAIEDVETKTKFRTAVGCDGLARKPLLVGNFKPDVNAPRKGLFFAGDTYKGRGLAANSSATSAMLCAEKVLRETD